MQYVPGTALMLGFSEAHQRNPSHEIIVRAAATSPRTIDAVIKAPGVGVNFYFLFLTLNGFSTNKILLFNVKEKKQNIPL